MASLLQKLMRLTRSLYPTGRAWRLPDGEFWTEIHRVLNLSEERALNEGSLAILNTILSDNVNFDEQDATDWERRLQMFIQPGTTIEDRRAAILRKYTAPGGILGRQSLEFMQDQLQLAGFNVFVHNNFSGLAPSAIVTLDPLSVGDEDAFLGADTAKLGAAEFDKVANRTDVVADDGFVLSTDLRATFFIGDAILGIFAPVPLVRQVEFRKLILDLKPAQTVALLFITYN